MQEQIRVTGKRKVRGIWQARFYCPSRRPKQKQRSLGLRDKRAAARRLNQLETLISKGEWDPWDDPAPSEGLLVEEVIDLYLKQRHGTVAPSTLRSDKSLLRGFAGDLPISMQVAYVEERHVRDYLSRPGLSTATVRTYYARFQRFFRWCVEEGHMRRSPVEEVTKPKRRRKEKRFLSKAEYERILAAIEADAEMKQRGLVDGVEVKHAGLQEGAIIWLADVVRFAAHTGLRRGEICAMRWSWIDLPGRRLCVRTGSGFTTKSGHERSVPLRGEALEVIRKLYEQRSSSADSYVFQGRQERRGDREQLNGRFVSRRFKDYVRMAKLSDEISFHTLRHTFISWMVQGGARLDVVQRIAGHADIQTTMQYAHLAPDDMGAEMDKVFGDNVPQAS